MSKIVNETIGKKTTGKIFDVVFAYVKIQTATEKYQSKDTEYTVDVVVDKATYREFKKAFPKNSAKDYENDEFTLKFKIDPPFSDQDEQYVLKLKAAAQLKADATAAKLVAGDDLPYEWSSRPKVFVPVEGGVKDITLTTQVGNGSKGTVAFTVNTNDFGTFPQLTGILVSELIEYEGSAGNSSAFGEVVGGYNTEKAKATKSETTAEAPVTSGEEFVPDADDEASADDEKSPF